MSKNKLEVKELEKNMLDIYNQIAAKARNGDLDSCFIIGLIFENLQTFNDEKKAFAIFKDLAKCGYRPAIIKVAVSLFQGCGVKQNFLKAYKLFAELAKDDSDIRDICIAWAAFEFNNKFVKEMKSAAKCKKGSQYVRDAIFGHAYVNLSEHLIHYMDYKKLEDAEYAYRRFSDEEGTADFLISKDDIDMSTIAQLYYVDDEDN
ncbi:MAG: hypothetical protein HRT87_02400 [Legionellales bacterium]|nr:hypothetical protein [Legionellales bacterium]